MRRVDDEPTGTKLSLIRAAGELFAQRGLCGTSTRAIADKAGSNIGCIHYYFGGKEGLYWAAVEYVFHRRITDQNVGVTLPEQATPQTVADALGELVRRRVLASCGPDVPAWHSQLLWRNVVDGLGSTHPGLLENVFQADFDRFAALVRRVRAELTDPQVRRLLYQMIAQLIFYVRYQPKVLRELGVAEYDTDLLGEVANHIARSLTRMLDLPDPARRGE